ncbi:MAG: 7-carboxy-7-deazaguanine synthase QueE [Armatimonadetes bacterium]|jgi:organic radical activating enzyme|nr:7-carboxy-7-deazaguanine synthase QueE [Armatimonadota bacterium]
MTDKGFIHEIFDSIQGEGLYCGQRHIFVRFAGCNLNCGYCDTPAAMDQYPPVCLIENDKPIDNPVTVDQVTDICRNTGFKVVSITGGEPLAQPEFLSSLMAALKEAGFVNYLETNGTLYRQLPSVIKCADVIAMDMKLPSATGNKAHWEDHSKFLEIASQTEVFVKIIVSCDTSEEEISRCCGIINGAHSKIPLIIQPLTGDNAPSGTLLMKLQEAAMRQAPDVRVIPQCHHLLGLK